jgi:Cof subfamily protein (haloacid dehalogenase superfamily)
MYKLIALDCDGTLLNSSGEITQKTAKTIKAVKNRGVKIVIASARPFYRLKRYLEQLDILSSDQYSIAFNGGLVINNLGDDILFSKNFTHDQVLELINISHNFNTKVILYAQNGIYSNIDEERYQRNNPEANFEVIDFNKLDYTENKIFKVVFLSSNDDTIQIRSRLSKDIYNKYEVSSSVPEYIEFVSKGITKSHSLELIANKFGIKPEEIIAFGDQENDLAMLNYAGYSVAMGNATENVKEKVNYITSSNNEDGIASAIEKIILQ